MEARPLHLPAALQVAHQVLARVRVCNLRKGENGRGLQHEEHSRVTFWNVHVGYALRFIMLPCFFIYRLLPGMRSFFSETSEIINIQKILTRRERGESFDCGLCRSTIAPWPALVGLALRTHSHTDTAHRVTRQGQPHQPFSFALSRDLPRRGADADVLPPPAEIAWLESSRSRSSTSLQLYLAMKSAWKVAIWAMTVSMSPSGGRKVVRKCHVSFFCRKPEPGTTTMPVVSRSARA